MQIESGSAPRAAQGAAVHWAVRMNRRNRTWCSLLLLATLAAHLAPSHPGPGLWSLLVLQFLVYPQLLYLRARRAPDQLKAEVNNFILDGFCLGLWAGALGFPVWISFIFLVTVTVNMTVFRGRNGFLQATASEIVGGVAAVALFGFSFHPDTGWLATALSIFTVSLYVLVVAENGFARAVKLHEARAALQRNEQELKRQLHEISVLQTRLREQANRDPLTGLHNRRYFDDTLQRELLRCEREQKPLAVIMLDIDHFKRINDEHGHQAGDEVLKMLSDILVDQVRGSDVASRYGGEEFMLLLPGADADVAAERVQRCRLRFGEARVTFDDEPIGTTLSAGIASYPQHGRSAAELIRASDLALYQAKALGRNCVVVSGTVTAVGRRNGAGRTAAAHQDSDRSPNRL